jgi:hypothetical protein
MDTATPKNGTVASSNYAAIGTPIFRSDTTGITTTEANTMSVLGAPISGQNETLVNTTALNVGSSNVAAGEVKPKNSYGLRVMAQTGASNNVAADIVGPLQLTTIGARPACTAALRGAAWFTQSPAGKADIYQICSKAADDTYNWVTH